MNRNVVRIASAVFVAFFIVIGYLTYIQIVQGKYLLHHPRNKRLQILGQNIIKGRVIDAEGKILAQTVVKDGKKYRWYPFAEVVSNVVGYESKKYGRGGLESTFNEAMLGLDNDFADDDFWSLRRLESKRRGNDVVLSLDAGLQQKAYGLLGNRKGAVVAIEPSTGRILVMVSKPGFNPNSIDADWNRLTDNRDSPLLNRAAQGLYPPGSTMKVVTAAGILTKKPETINRVFDAPGFVVIEGRRIEDKQARGRLTFTKAFAVSSNYVFANLGIELGARNLAETASGFGLNRKIAFALPIAQSSIPNPETFSKLELGETAIGQGRVTVTPLNMAMIAAAVANNGKMMLPSLIDEIRGPDGSIIKKFQPETMSVSAKESVAAQLRELMVAVVSRGTGSAAAIQNIQVAGKTGSAQNPHGIPHAWFIGFAPADKPKIAVAVIVENGGAGGHEAAPVAAEIIKAVIR